MERLTEAEPDSAIRLLGLVAAQWLNASGASAPVHRLFSSTKLEPGNARPAARVLCESNLNALSQHFGPMQE